MVGACQVVPKDPETLARLQKAIQGNLLFQHLEEAALNDVLATFFLDSRAAGDVIMKQVWPFLHPARQRGCVRR